MATVQMIIQGGLPHGASPAGLGLRRPDVPHPLSAGEIAKIVAEYGWSAARALEAGLDGIELHANHDDLPRSSLTVRTAATTRTEPTGSGSCRGARRRARGERGDDGRSASGASTRRSRAATASRTRWRSRAGSTASSTTCTSTSATTGRAELRAADAVRRRRLDADGGLAARGRLGPRRGHWARDRCGAGRANRGRWLRRRRRHGARGDRRPRPPAQGTHRRAATPCVGVNDCLHRTMVDGMRFSCAVNPQAGHELAACSRPNCGACSSLAAARRAWRSRARGRARPRRDPVGARGHARRPARGSRRADLQHAASPTTSPPGGPARRWRVGGCAANPVHSLTHVCTPRGWRTPGAPPPSIDGGEAPGGRPRPRDHRPGRDRLGRRRRRCRPPARGRVCPTCRGSTSPCSSATWCRRGATGRASCSPSARITPRRCSARPRYAERGVEVHQRICPGTELTPLVGRDRRRRRAAVQGLVRASQPTQRLVGVTPATSAEAKAARPPSTTSTRRARLRRHAAHRSPRRALRPRPRAHALW